MLGDRLREGVIDVEALRNLDAFRSEFSIAYRYVEDMLGDKLRYVVTGRPSKSTVAIVEKLKRESTRLSQMQDIAGCRIITPDIQAQDAMCDVATVMLGDVSIVDRRVNPTNGYRAVHLIAKHQGKAVEIQVRTRVQHAWAEMSEKISDTYGQGIKYGKGEEWAVSFLNSLSKLTAELERIRSDKKDVRGGASRSIYLGNISGRNAKKMLKELDSIDRQCMYKIRALFNEIKDK